MTPEPVVAAPAVTPSLRDQALAETDRVIDAERQSPEKGQVSVEASPDGLEATASVGINAHVTAGGFFKRTWAGVISYGAKIKAVWK